MIERRALRAGGTALKDHEEAHCTPGDENREPTVRIASLNWDSYERWFTGELMTSYQLVACTAPSRRRRLQDAARF
jgi:hypothetical protein